MHIAVLGGTFDPIHMGHIMVAEVVRKELSPSEVVFIPAGNPWTKAQNHISPAEDRLAMVKIAVADKPGFSVSPLEIERQGPTYTVDTMRELRKRLPSRDELFFVLGWDNLLDLSRWHRPEELLALCRLVAVPRVGYRIPDEKKLEGIIPGLSQRVILLDKPEVDISASVIRERVKRGLLLTRLVPEAVERYIREKGLYR